jgi:hypothetical protein
MREFLLGFEVAAVVVSRLPSSMCALASLVHARDLPIDWLESKIAMPAVDAAVHPHSHQRGRIGVERPTMWMLLKPLAGRDDLS